MSKHTPGPWIVSNECERDIFGGPDTFVAICSLHPADVDSAMDEWDHGPITAANRALIIAAPDLLEALKVASQELTMYIDFQQKHDYIEYAADTQKKLDTVNAAIAKAEGQS